ncbi:metallophosphoesterase [Ramlibacter monticola]|uniref:Metallophosphoesterase n=1 Tax=Ramlibacter monticola TaxID=1926872 RepID=A0A936Z1Q2_9BURK|nr:metallophosphoesterase [Ramlibacter monticola]MBL0392661.1 metallophosphoesterase [Ramlibacter monticola]
MSLLTVLALSATLHLYIAARVTPQLPWPAGAAFVALLVASALLVPLSLLARRVLRPPAADRLAWAGMLCMGLFSSLLVLTVMRDLMLLALAVTNLDQPQWEENTAAAVPLLALALSLIGLINARRTARVVRVPVPIAGLAAPLDGFRIVQISDIHVGPTIKRDYLEAIVARVNALRPDLVAITGDLVDGSVQELASHVAPLAQLKSRHGSFFVTGNHEYYSGVHGWMRELQRLGVRVLHNEHVVLHHDGADLVLAGVPDYGGHHFDAQHRSDPAQAVQGAPAGAPRVLLAHQPRTAPAAAAAGFDLQLSGHTHGGQFLPWTFLVPLQQPYTAGLHQLDRLWIYVSRGTGYWGPPKRIGAPSEIAELLLVPSV